MESIGPNDLAIAALVAVGIAAAVRLFARNLSVLAGARRDATTDPLTGLGNRTQLMEDLEDELVHSSPDSPRVLALLDLDGFKNYNDSFGHPSGDALLARLGRALGAAVHPWGSAYRLGGDEFCVVVRDRSWGLETVISAAAAALSDRGRGFDVRPSCGMVALPEEAATPEAVLELAERRLYAEKHGRRELRTGDDAREALQEALRERKPTRPERLDGVAALARAAGRQLGLASDELDVVVRAAELYDVGKMAVPDTILSKPGPLSDEEWGYFRQHTLVGDRILSASGAMVPVARLVRSCHERVDGTGYPDGLAGEEIPLGARIIAVCDAYQAMTAERPYRDAMDPVEAFVELRRNAGTQFDGAVVDAFCEALVPQAEPVARAGRTPRPRTLLLGAAMAVLALAAPSGALAGTASTTGSQLNVTAGSLETNNITIATVGLNVQVVETGSGASLSAGAGCTPAGVNTVDCPLVGLTSIAVNTLDRDDKVTVSTPLPANIQGGTDDDMLTGGPLADTLDGGDGYDWLDGGLGGDTLIGGPSLDLASWAGRTLAVVADLDGVADDGVAGEGDNAGADIEALVGGNADDTLSGNAADNGLDGGAGADNLNGGDGNDFALYWSRTAPVTVDFDGVADDGEAGENDNFGADVESVIGGSAADTLRGGPGVNHLSGWGGDDTLDGRGGADVMWGGSGIDHVTYASRDGAVSASLDDTANDGEAGEGDNLYDVENLTGGAGSDTLIGTAFANRLVGGAGRDTLIGHDGDDVIDVHDGREDDVTCGNGADSVAADNVDIIGIDCDSVERFAEPPSGGSSDGDAGGAQDDPKGQAGAPVLRSQTVRLNSAGNALVSIRCPRTAVGGCKGRITLKLLRGKRGVRASLATAKRKRGKRRGKVIGRGRFSLEAGEAAKIKVKLSRNGRRRVLRKRSVRCSVNVSAIGEDGARTITKGVLTLKPPKERR